MTARLPGWQAAYDNARSRNLPHETARLFADQWQGGLPSGRSYVPCNILGCANLVLCGQDDDPMHLSCDECFWDERLMECHRR